MNWNFVPDLEVSGATSKAIPLLALDLSQLEKYQSNYQRMTGSVVSGKPRLPQLKLDTKIATLNLGVFIQTNF